MPNNFKIRQLSFAFILFLSLCSLSIYRHKKVPLNSFRSEIWADRGGYYVYLPSTFLYKYSSVSFPENIEKLTGEGFKLDSGKVIIKYTYGVALLESPFYFFADFATLLSSRTRDGFSLLYQKAIDIASVFYLVLGLYILFHSLKIYTNYSNKIILTTLAVLFFGTNLYYYSIIEGGMSHIYSFFLFSYVLYLITHKEKFKQKHLYHLSLSLIFALIILIRPTNIIIAIILISWNAGSFKEIILNQRNRITLKVILIWLLSFLIVFLPQLFYWKYAYGSYFSYSYTNEGFTNLFSPKILEVIFSPHNGLLPYSLILIVAILGIMLMIRDKKLSGTILIFTLLLEIFITASWHDWQFGCGCGMRNMVEYYSILSVPLSLFIHKLYSIRQKFVKITAFASIGILVFICFKVNYHYYGCYFGTIWDWHDYLNTFTYPLKIK